MCNIATVTTVSGRTPSALAGVPPKFLFKPLVGSCEID